MALQLAECQCCGNKMATNGGRTLCIRCTTLYKLCECCQSRYIPRGTDYCIECEKKTTWDA